MLPLIVVLGVALRVWRILSNGLTFDESFTTLAGRLPVSDLLSYLRHNDSHPPLDYLIRAPFARAGRATSCCARRPCCSRPRRSRCSRGGCANAVGSA